MVPPAEEIGWGQLALAIPRRCALVEWNEKDIRQHILEHIANKAGFRLLNTQNGTATVADKELLGEALGFRSLCLFSNINDEDLKRVWDASNLEYSL